MKNSVQIPTEGASDPLKSVTSLRPQFIHVSSFKEHFTVCVKYLILASLLFGVVYPQVILSLGRFFFHDFIDQKIVIAPAEISNVHHNENKRIIVGHELVANNLQSPYYFSPRPSFGNYSLIPTKASQLASTAKNKSTPKNKEDAAEMQTTSGSGIDPHISPKAAFIQLEEIVKMRNLSPEMKEKLKFLIESLTEKKTFSILGHSRINVLRLNLAMEEMLKEKSRGQNK